MEMNNIVMVNKTDFDEMKNALVCAWETRKTQCSNIEGRKIPEDLHDYWSNDFNKWYDLYNRMGHSNVAKVDCSNDLIRFAESVNLPSSNGGSSTTTKNIPLRPDQVEYLNSIMNGSIVKDDKPTRQDGSTTMNLIYALWLASNVSGSKTYFVCKNEEIRDAIESVLKTMCENVELCGSIEVLSIDEFSFSKNGIKGSTLIIDDGLSYMSRDAVDELVNGTYYSKVIVH